MQNITVVTIVYFLLYTTGEFPIITNRLKVTIKKLDKANEPSIKSIVINKKPDCKDTTLISNGSTICGINNVSLDLINKYYLIITTYKDVAARYNLGG